MLGHREGGRGDLSVSMPRKAHQPGWRMELVLWCRMSWVLLRAPQSLAGLLEGRQAPSLQRFSCLVTLCCPRSQGHGCTIPWKVLQQCQASMETDWHVTWREGSDGVRGTWRRIFHFILRKWSQSFSILNFCWRSYLSTEKKSLRSSLEVVRKRK